MSLVMPEETQGEFEVPPENTYTATCYRVVDLGTQQTEYNGETKRQHKVMLSWELADAPMSDGRPFTMHQRYTLSSHEKAILRKHLEAWRGKQFTKEEFGTFEISNLIAKSCLLQVLHAHKNGKTYANIAAIMKLPKGLPVPPVTNPTVNFSLNDFKAAEYEKLSENLRAIIAKSPEYQRLMGAHKVEDQVADDHNGEYGATGHIDQEIPF